jgi:putative hemolysin
MFEVLLILICLIFNALLAGSETAFIALSPSSLKEWVKKGNQKAQLLLTLRENPERTLSIIQIGITFLGAFAAALGGAGAEETITPWLIHTFKFKEPLAEIVSLMIVVIPLTFISVVIGELVPKTLALRRPLFFASKSAPWLFQASRFIDPIVSLLEWSTKLILSYFPKEHIVHEENSEESAILIEHLSPFDKQYILNIVKIEKTTLQEISLNWSEVVYVDSHQSSSEVEQIIISSGHTRLPVMKDQEVVGVINAKEFLAFQKTGQNNWLSIIRVPIKPDGQLPILSALRLMQKQRSHMAIVYQGQNRRGIITMEAIFEEIVGDIYDEEDEGSLKRILARLK